MNPLLLQDNKECDLLRASSQDDSFPGTFDPLQTHYLTSEKFTLK